MMKTSTVPKRAAASRAANPAEKTQVIFDAGTVTLRGDLARRVSEMAEKEGVAAEAILDRILKFGLDANVQEEHDEIPAGLRTIFEFGDMSLSGLDALLVDDAGIFYLGHQFNPKNEVAPHPEAVTTQGFHPCCNWQRVSIVAALEWYAENNPNYDGARGDVEELCKAAAMVLRRLSRLRPHVERLGPMLALCEKTGIDPDVFIASAVETIMNSLDPAHGDYDALNPIFEECGIKEMPAALVGKGVGV